MDILNNIENTKDFTNELESKYTLHFAEDFSNW